MLEPDTAAANLQSGKYGKERITIVTKTPGNLLRLIDQGYHLESDITVGNMSGGSGKKKICKHISVTPEDIEAFRKLDAMQYHLYQQTVPSETPAPFMKHLEDALAQG